MILIILSSLFGLIFLVALAGFLLPRKIHVKRSIQIQASTERIWSEISDFENFKIWNPWAEKDPNMKVDITGKAKGSKYAWSGNKSVRSGSMMIVDMIENEKVDFELHFGQSKTPSFTSLIIEKEENGSKVTWTMDTDMGNNPAGRYMGLFMDKFVGKDYDKGLENLKEKCESEPPSID